MSVLRTVSKIFERITHSQMSIFVQKFLCPQCVGTEKVLVHNKPYYL